MKINYELTKNDLILFNMYHFENSKAKSLIFMRFFLPAVLIIYVFIMQTINLNNIIFFVIACLWLALYPIVMKKYFLNNINQFFSKENNIGMICKHSIEINDESIIETSENSEVKHICTTVEKIIESKSLIFIYVNTDSAYIVPIKAFKNDKEKEYFIDLLKYFKGK